MHVARMVIKLLLLVLLLLPIDAVAESTPSIYENSVSATLDLWRDGRYEQLFDHLARRGKISREQFVRKMRDNTIKPSCCWQKIEHFKVLREKRNSATVYAKIGLDGIPTAADSVTREFKLVNEHGEWKMQLNDIIELSGSTRKKHKKTYRKVVHYH